MRVAHSVLAGEGVAELLRAHYDLAPVRGCRLLRRGFNEVYLVEHEGGARRVARLAALRARGPSNADYEVALLERAAARGARVAEPVRPRSGAAGVEVPLPEGLRRLTLFGHVEGDLPETPDDVELTGEGLARLHRAVEGYAGPPSRYELDVEHLLRAPLARLLEAPTLDAGSRARFRAAAVALESELVRADGLARVHCHGDCHGGNNFVRGADGGAREAVFFDFDDAAPGPLAYDLAVFLWSRLLRGAHASPTEEVAGVWNRYLAGYRRRREIAAPDVEAVPAFVRARHFLWLGELASRRHHWGSEALPRRWLGEQAELVERWGELRASGE